MSFMDILEDKEEEFDRIKRRCLTELNEETTKNKKRLYRLLCDCMSEKDNGLSQTLSAVLKKQIIPFSKFGCYCKL